MSAEDGDAVYVRVAVPNDAPSPLQRGLNSFKKVLSPGKSDKKKEKKGKKK